MKLKSGSNRRRASHARWPGAILLACLALILGSGCFSRLISPYSETAYQLATSLKVESLILMDKATEPYSTQRQKVEAFQENLQKALEYAKGRPKNEMSARQWELMLDPNRHLLGGFLQRWRERGRLSRTFIDEAKPLVSDGFDEIIGLESGKEREPSHNGGEN
jgi:hypothetical protein